MHLPLMPAACFLESDSRRADVETRNRKSRRNSHTHSMNHQADHEADGMTFAAPASCVCLEECVSNKMLSKTGT